MPDVAGDFNPWDDLEGIFSPPFHRPQCRVYPIMIGDGDDIQVSAAGNIIKQFAYRRQTIARGGVHVQVSASKRVVGHDRLVLYSLH